MKTAEKRRGEKNGEERGKEKGEKGRLVVRGVAEQRGFPHCSEM